MMKMKGVSLGNTEINQTKTKNWFLRHKIITGIIIFLIFSIIVGANSEKSDESFDQGKNDTVKKEFIETAPTKEVTSIASPTETIQNTNQNIEVTKFSQEDALSKLKGYELKNNVESLNKSTLGMYLATCMEELVLQGMKADATTTTGKWSAKADNNDGVYTINYQFRSLGLDRIYTWEVGKDSIKAINGKAITITPELGPQEKEVSGSDREKQIYEYSTNLYNKFETTLGSYEAETRATSETAKKFNITEEEVETIVSRLMDTKI